MGATISAAAPPVGYAGASMHERSLGECLCASAGGCDGLNVLGSTGEANSIDLAARRDVTAAASLVPSVEHLVRWRIGDARWQAGTPPFPPLTYGAARNLETALSGLQPVEPK